MNGNREAVVCENGVIYAANFDINSSNLFCDGRVEVKKQNTDMLLTVIMDGQRVISFNMAEIKELVITAHIGCSSLEAVTVKGDSFRLCRFSQSCIGLMSEFVKACNYYFDTGELTEISYEQQHCPKCGRRYFAGSSVCIKCVDKGSVFKRFLSYGKNAIPGFLAAAFLLFVANVVSLIIPYVNRILVDNYLSPADGASVIGDNPARSVLLLVGLMLFMYVFQRLFSIVPTIIRVKTGQGFINHLRVKVYDKVQRLSLSSVFRRTTGDLMKRVSDDTQEISHFIEGNVLWFVQIITRFAGVLIFLLITRPIMALLIFLPVPLVLFLMSKIWGFIHSRYERQWILGSRCNSILHDIVKGIRVVKVFGTENREIEKYRLANKKFADICSENEKIWAVLMPFLNFVIGASEFLILYYGATAVFGTNVFGDSMSLGELTQTVTYAGVIYSSLHGLTGWPRDLANAVTSMVKINEIMDEELEIKDSVNAISPEIKGEITFKNVTFGYKSYEPVLKNISLKIKQGEMVGLVGHSGVGKSTLINLVMRLYDVNSGRVEIDGHDIREISRETLCNDIGVVFQETYLFAGSIYDNIAYAKPDATPEEVFAAARIANAHEFIIKLPDAYNTVVGENGHSLSGGERQRVAIARAILKDPKILILDEATASLDTETESKIQEALQQLIKGRTTIAIAHRLSTLRHADRIIVLEKGKLHEEGPHEELLKKKGIYYNLVMAQKETTKMASSNV